MQTQVCYEVLPDLNSMNYNAWDSITAKGYAGRMEKFIEQELNDKIEEKWEEISVTKICRSISSLIKT